MHDSVRDGSAAVADWQRRMRGVNPVAALLPCAVVLLVLARLLPAVGAVGMGAAPFLDIPALLLAGTAAVFAVRRQAAPLPIPLARPPSGRDFLTGLLERSTFLQEVEARAARGEAFGLLLVDVDHFRTVRAGHGLTAADELLREMACHLAGLVPSGTLLARKFDDVFAALVPGVDRAAAAALAASCQAGLAYTLTIGGTRIDATVSIGGAVFPEDARRGGDLLRAAHVALLDAKTRGGDTWRLFDRRLGQAAQTRSELGAALRGAIDAGQFVPYYQPIVDLASGEVAGWEVLARWRHPLRGLLLPHSFIALAEEQKLCAALSVSLLRQVIADCASWPTHWSFAFNASPGQLPELLEFVRDPAVLPPDMLDPRRIELEVTETALIEDMELARRVVRAMHRGGSKVVLDDFGTGYANFVHLREIPFDRIKIDRAFVATMLSDARTEACVRAMLALARSLDVSVIAEGVETEAMAAHLRALGCQQAQGYRYAPPVPAADVLRVAAIAAQAGMAA